MMERMGNRFYSRSLQQLVEIENQLMHPALTGRDIDPYSWESENYLLFPYGLKGHPPQLISPKEMISNYPKAWEYLNHGANRELLEGRDKGAFRDSKDWYGYARPQNMNLIGRHKLVGPDVAGQAEFTYNSIYGFA
jgi:hypothetical protein